VEERTTSASTHLRFEEGRKNRWKGKNSKQTLRSLRTKICKDRKKGGSKAEKNTLKEVQRRAAQFEMRQGHEKLKGEKITGTGIDSKDVFSPLLVRRGKKVGTKRGGPLRRRKNVHIPVAHH